MPASRVVETGSRPATVVAAPTLIAQITRPQDQWLVLTLWATFFAAAFTLLAWAHLSPVAEKTVAALFVA